MPRKASGKHEQQREYQRKYREKLAMMAKPESQDLDTSCAAGIASLVRALEAKHEFDDEKAVLDFVLKAALADLKARGFDARESGILLHRRLTWLKVSQQNPEASNLEKRGFKG